MGIQVLTQAVASVSDAAAAAAACAPGSERFAGDCHAGHNHHAAHLHEGPQPHAAHAPQMSWCLDQTCQDLVGGAGQERNLSTPGQYCYPWTPVHVTAAVREIPEGSGAAAPEMTLGIPAHVSLDILVLQNVGTPEIVWTQLGCLAGSQRSSCSWGAVDP